MCGEEIDSDDMILCSICHCDNCPACRDPETEECVGGCEKCEGGCGVDHDEDEDELNINDPVVQAAMAIGRKYLQQDKETPDQWFDRKYPKAKCHSCDVPVTGATVKVCGDENGSGCEMWFCATCYTGDGCEFCISTVCDCERPGPDSNARGYCLKCAPCECDNRECTVVGGTCLKQSAEYDLKELDKELDALAEKH